MNNRFDKLTTNLQVFFSDYMYRLHSKTKKIILIVNHIFHYIKTSILKVFKHICANSITYCFIFIAFSCLLTIGNQAFLNDYILPLNNFNLSKIKDQQILLEYYIAKQTHGIRVLTIFAGFIGMLLAFWRSYNLDQNRKNDTKKEVNERFTKAVELLGHNSEAVRIGALYTLDHISKENNTYTKTCIDIISSYFRNEMKSPRIAIIRNDWNEKFKYWYKTDKKDNISDYTLNTKLVWNYKTQPTWELPEDLKTALKIITYRSRKELINFKQLDFIGVDFSNTIYKLNYIDFANTCFKHSRFAEKTEFKGCILNYCNFGKAYLAAANFTNLNLQRTIFTKSLLQYSNFKNADLTLTNFKGADLQNTKFKNARLYFTNLFDADLEYQLFNSNKFFSAFLQVDNYKKIKNQYRQYNFYRVKGKWESIKLLIKDLNEEELFKCGLLERK